MSSKKEGRRGEGQSPSHEVSQGKRTRHSFGMAGAVAVFSRSLGSDNLGRDQALSQVFWLNTRKGGSAMQSLFDDDKGPKPAGKSPVKLIVGLLLTAIIVAGYFLLK